MTWPAGFLTTVTVAFVLCDMSVSDELCTLAELSLRVEPLVQLDSVTDEVLGGGGGGGDGGAPTNERVGTGVGSDTKFWEWITETEFESAFNGVHSSDAVEIVLHFESVLCLTNENSVSIGPEISCEAARESSLTDGSIEAVLTLLAGGCSTCGLLVSRSFSDSITASMNI